LPIFEEMGNGLLITGTYGLVVCGGKSSRMQQDKSMLNYHGKPQRYHVYGMLQPFCEKVFISCNEMQSLSIDLGYEQLADNKRYVDIGPMAGLLTAFANFPGKNILFIGCDYPFLSKPDLEEFSALCKNQPAAFFDQQDSMYEPLLAWYPYSCMPMLHEMFTTGTYSLRRFLEDNRAIKYIPSDTSCIRSIDDPQEYLQAYQRLNS
jgi:molybdenum cofactor guanylyltransferase